MKIQIKLHKICFNTIDLKLKSSNQIKQKLEAQV